MFWFSVNFYIQIIFMSSGFFILLVRQQKNNDTVKVEQDWKQNKLFTDQNLEIRTFLMTNFLIFFLNCWKYSWPNFVASTT